MSANTDLRFVCIAICTGDQATNPHVVSTEFFDTSCSTLVKARDLLIKRERTKYVKDFGSDRHSGCYEPASELIYKFSFRDKLVGFHHFDDGLTFLFEEGHPVYKLIVSGKCPGDKLAEHLVDLWVFYDDQKANRQDEDLVAAA